MRKIKKGSLLIVLSTMLVMLFSSTAMAAHHHTDSCYTNIYHSHSDSCYRVTYHQHSAEGGSCYTPVYHSHSAEGGSCYSPVYHTHTESCHSIKYHSHKSSCYRQETKTRTVRCGGLSGASWQNGNGEWYATCTTCGYAWRVSGSGCYFSCSATKEETYTENVLICKKNKSTVESDTIICGKDENTIDSYTLSCGKSEDTIESYKLSCGKDSSTEESRSLICGKSESTIESRQLTCGQQEYDDPTPQPDDTTPAKKENAPIVETTPVQTAPNAEKQDKEEQAPKVIKTEKTVSEPKTEEESVEETLEDTISENNFNDVEEESVETTHIDDDVTPKSSMASSVAGWLGNGGILASLFGINFAGIAGGLFVFWYRAAKVYAIDEDDEYVVIGRKSIFKYRDGFRVCLSDRVINRINSSDYRIVLNTNFVKANEGKIIYIKLPNETVLDFVIDQDTDGYDFNL